MHKYIIKTNFKTLEFESVHHMINMKALDFYGMPFVVFEDAKMAVNLQQVRELYIDGISYQLRSYALQ